MDKLTTYRKLITRLLSELSDLSNRCPTPGVESVCAFDEERDQYLLLSIGWHGNRRASGVRSTPDNVGWSLRVRRIRGLDSLHPTTLPTILPAQATPWPQTRRSIPRRLKPTC